MPAVQRDLSRTQIERCVLAVYTDLVQRKRLDAADPGTVRRAFAICQRSLQRGGYLAEGTWMPTLKGEVRSREKLRDPDAEVLHEAYEAMLALARTRGPKPEKPSLALMMVLSTKRSARLPVSSPQIQVLGRKQGRRGAANVGVLPLPHGSVNRATGLRERLLPLRGALDEVFACSTAFGDCRRDAPSAGHCMLASMVVQDLFGGCIVSGEIKGVPHYWNRIGRIDVDLTGDQFGYLPVRVKAGALYPGGHVFPRERGRSLVLPFNVEIMGKYQSFANKLIRRLRGSGQGEWSTALARTQATTKELAA